ncbi:MAG: ABC transporter ATP-binding protein [Spirochaetota bacterium]
MLELRELDVFIGKTHVLKRVSLTVEYGQIVALIGANGAGKTTTLAAIAGLLRPRNGRILFRSAPQSDVIEVTHKPAEELVSLGVSLCPEGRQVFTSLNVRENLLIGAYLRRDRRGIRADLGYVFSLFPILRERQRQAAGSLSGGEQMMLAIGRALMSRPRLLLMDEPSLGLAPNLVEKLFVLLKSINQNGTTILLVEQNASMALRLSHYAYVLESGKLTLSGGGTELLDNEAVHKAYLGLA